MRVTFQLDETIQVFRLGTTTNKKITNGSKIVQSYTFSVEQFNYIKDCLDNEIKPIFKTFFSLDSKNCFDCPFSINSNQGGKCYTHKVMQYSGFVSMLKSILKEFTTLDNIPNYLDNMLDINGNLLSMATNRYVRFGSYGEPSVHPIESVALMVKVANSWTGYTHQYIKKPEFAKYFMASTHNEMQAKIAIDKFSYRSFIATNDNSNTSAIICPASNEGGNKANCADCGLCSGTMGKGKKNVIILQH